MTGVLSSDVWLEKGAETPGEGTAAGRKNPMGRGSGHGAGKTGKSGGSARGNFSLPKKNKKPRPPPAIAKTLEPAPAPKARSSQ